MIETSEEDNDDVEDDEDETTDGYDSGAEEPDGEQSGSEAEASGREDTARESDEVAGESEKSSESEIICPNSEVRPRAVMHSVDEDSVFRVKRPSNRPANGSQKKLDFGSYASSCDEEEEMIYAKRKRQQEVSRTPKYNLRSRSRPKQLIAIDRRGKIIRSPRYRLRRRERHALPAKSSTGMIAWNSVDLECEEEDEGPRAKQKAQQDGSTSPADSVEDIGFDRIAGVEDFLLQLKEMVILPLVYPALFKDLEIVPPRGVLFYGPPGTGKTLLARILASTASKLAGRPVAFFHRNGSECLSKWIGEAEQNLAKLFKQARQQAPSIIFFDEIDGLAPDRSGGGKPPDQSHVSLVSMLLSLMDGLEDRGSVIVIGATNRIDALDPALRRPGRFDKEFYFGLPDVKARHEILRICASRKTEPHILERLARETEGLSGAELKGICTEASLIAMRRTFPLIYQLGSIDVGAEPVESPDPTVLQVIEADYIQALGQRKQHVTISAEPALPKPMARLLEPMVKQLLRDIERITVKRERHAANSWSCIRSSTIRLPIAVIDFEDSGLVGSLEQLDLARMKRAFLYSLALKIVPSPSFVAILDLAMLLQGAPEAVLMGKYRAAQFTGRVLIVPDLARLYTLLDDDGVVFSVWLEEWSMSETGRLLLAMPVDMDLLSRCVHQQLPLAFSLVPQQERQRFINWCLRIDNGTADLADLMGVVRTSSYDEAESGPMDPEEEIPIPVDHHAVYTTAWLNSFARATALFHKRTDDQLIW